MQKLRNHINFILNDETVSLDKVPSNMTLLDYLRINKSLCGTKEGCGEGDCGACTVLVGRVSKDQLVYETVNSCIRFVGSLDGCHIVTIEHLRKSDGTLHPVQQAMVDHHGSQCGFCTPGFVMSLYALWMHNPAPSQGEIEQALQGNLCRCTGYEPIIHAALAISSIDHPKNDPLVSERKSIMKRLSNFVDGARVEIKNGDDMIFVPSSLNDLADLRVAHPDATLVAGSTDVGLWVTKHLRPISPVIFIGQVCELNTIELSADKASIGACVTYQGFQDTIQSHFAPLTEVWMRIGGGQVRNMGTIGGNIANGSPIGDTPPALIALGTEITLRTGHEQRTIDLEKFFIEYGKQDRELGDFLETIHIPFAKQNDVFAVYKISKRRDEDISAVCGAFKLSIDKDIITDARIVFGGMAATPKRASHVEKAVIGKQFNQTTVEEALPEFEKDFTPLSDMRASQEYRMLVAKNMLRRYVLEHQGKTNIRLTRGDAA